MICPKCNVESIISKSEIVFTGDNTPDEETKAFRKLHFVCRNPNCSEAGKEICCKEVEIK